MTYNILLAVSLGILPTLLWLWFWLKEDPHPEPTRDLLLAFSAGGISAIVAFGYEWIFFEFTNVTAGLAGAVIAATSTSSIIVFAAIEELTKYLSARVSALRTKDFNEPVDAMIYLITAGLGFAAAENILFLLGSFNRGFLEGLVVSNLRFVSTALLHGLTTAIIGAGIAFSFFNKKHRARDLTIGLFTAIILHTAYNLLIIKNVGGGGFGYALAILWISGGIVLLLFEKAKKIDH